MSECDIKHKQEILRAQSCTDCNSSTSDIYSVDMWLQILSWYFVLCYLTPGYQNISYSDVQY